MAMKKKDKVEDIIEEVVVEEGEMVPVFRMKKTPNSTVCAYCGLEKVGVECAVCER